MIPVAHNELHKIEQHFTGFNDAMLFSCLEGNMGQAYVQSWERTAAAIMVEQEYCYFGGDATSPEAEYLAKNLFVVAKHDHMTSVFIQDAWIDTLMHCTEYAPTIVPRYRIAFKEYNFDLELLQHYIDALPQEYVMVPFDRNLYEQSLQEKWSREFCDSFRSAEDYLEKGFGFAVLKDGKFVSGTSTMATYSTGVELKTATREEYRRRGLALPCCAAMVKECVRRGLHPGWDAVTLISKKMALKLGYEYAGEFATIHLHRKPEDPAEPQQKP